MRHIVPSQNVGKSKFVGIYQSVLGISVSQHRMASLSSNLPISSQFEYFYFGSSLSSSGKLCACCEFVPLTSKSSSDIEAISFCKQIYITTQVK